MILPAPAWLALSESTPVDITARKSCLQRKFLKIALAPHDFAGIIFLIWFVNCKTIEINWCNAAFFPNGWFDQYNLIVPINRKKNFTYQMQLLLQSK